MPIWTVNMEDQAEAELLRMLKSGIVTREDIKVIKRWLTQMEEHGPESIENSPEWHDHPLERDEKWKGCRSSAFSSSGRIIYKIFEERIEVQVVRVTTDHNYK